MDFRALDQIDEDTFLLIPRHGSIKAVGKNVTILFPTREEAEAFFTSRWYATLELVMPECEELPDGWCNGLAGLFQ